MEINLDRCYLHFVTDDVVTLFRLYDGYKRTGEWPHDGTLIDQPAQLVAAFDLIDMYLAEAKEQA